MDIDWSRHRTSAREVWHFREVLDPRTLADEGRPMGCRSTSAQHHRGGRGGPPGIPIDWRTHAQAGVPVTVATLAIAAAYLVLIH